MKNGISGDGLAEAAAQARRAIHGSNIEQLKQLVAAHPALLSWQEDGDHGGLLGFATDAYGDAGDAQREEWFTRGACAELLIDAGAVVTPSVVEGLLSSRARGLLTLFHRKGLLPRTLKFLAALGDVDGVRTALGEIGNDLHSVNEAFVCACHFDQQAVASFLLERSIALDPDLGRLIDGRTERSSFMKTFEKSALAQVAEFGLWKVFVMEQLMRAIPDRDLAAFAGLLQREPWLLGDAHVVFQAKLIDTEAFQKDGGAFIGALFDVDPAILHRQPPPPSKAIEWAFTYGNTHLLPLLTRIWPMPDDLPHAAGSGDLARVKQWFDSAGVERLAFEPGSTIVKLFQNVPRDDLEMVFPNVQVRMRGIDKLLIGVPAVVSGIVVIATKLISTLGLVLVLLAFWLGLSDKTVEINQTALVSIGIGLFAVGAYVIRQITNFKNRKILFMKALAENLYFRNLDNDAGVFHHLLDAAEEAEVTEAVLAYHFLRTSPEPLTPSELDARVEAWFASRCETPVDFDVHDGLRKLREHSLVDEDADGRLRAVTLAEAKRRMDTFWDNLFDYNVPVAAK